MPRSPRLLRAVAGAEDRRLFQVANGVSKGISPWKVRQVLARYEYFWGQLSVSAGAQARASAGPSLLLTAPQRDFSVASWILRCDKVYGIDIGPS